MERSLAVVDVHRSGQFHLADGKIRPEPFPRWMPQGAAELAVFHIPGQLGVNPMCKGQCLGERPANGDALRCNGFKAVVSRRRSAVLKPVPTV